MLDLQCQLGVDIPAVFAGAVGKLGRGALRTPHIMGGLEGVMRAALALPLLADFLYRLHVLFLYGLAMLALRIKRQKASAGLLTRRFDRGDKLWSPMESVKPAAVFCP